MVSIYTVVSQIHPPDSSGHVCYHWISIHSPMLLSPSPLFQCQRVSSTSFPPPLYIAAVVRNWLSHHNGLRLYLLVLWIGVTRGSSNYTPEPSTPKSALCIFLQRFRKYMWYSHITSSLTVTKMNLIDKMPCGYGMLRSIAVIIQYQVSCWSGQRFQWLSKFSAEIPTCLSSPKVWSTFNSNLSILNPSPSLQVLSEAHKNTLAEFENTVLGSRGDCKHVEVFMSRCQGYRSVWEIGMLLLEQSRFC